VRYRFNEDVVLKGRTCGKREPRPYQPNATFIAKTNRPEKNEPIVKPHIDAEADRGICDHNKRPGRRSSTSRGRESYRLAVTNDVLPVTSETFYEAVSPLSSQASVATADGDLGMIPTTLADALEPWENYCLLYCKSSQHRHLTAWVLTC
jgi:hypothetical protein